MKKYLKKIIKGNKKRKSFKSPVKIIKKYIPQPTLKPQNKSTLKPLHRNKDGKIETDIIFFKIKPVDLITKRHGKMGICGLFTSEERLYFQKRWNKLKK